MFFANTILIVSGLILFALSLGILLSNPRKSVNRTLAAFLASGFTWLLTNFMTNIASSDQSALLFAKTTLVGATLVPYTFLLFCVAFRREKLNLRTLLLYSILPVLVLSVAPTSLNIRSAEAYGRNVVTGPVYPVLIALILGYFLYGFYLLRKLYKEANSVKKAQLAYIFVGIALTLIPGVITNGILPSIGVDRAAAYGPNVVVIVSLFMTLAIVKHRLLDIRIIVARSMAYIFSLIILAISYSLISLMFLNKLADSSQNRLTLGILNTLFLAVLVSTYPLLKKFFDKVTNRIFYRDAYDSQAFLDKLNKVLVGTIDLEDLLKSSAQIIQQDLKAEFCLFGIKETDSSPQRIIGTQRKAIGEEDANFVRDLTPHIHTKVIVTDYLETDKEALKYILQKYDIAILARLVTNTKQVVEGNGYLLLGPKKSGNPYSSQDIKLLNIIVNELVIAIQNALRFEEIENFNLTLQQKVTDATRQLRANNEKLKALDQSKDEFISMASHQLRTPLTSVKGYVSMVLDGDAGPVTVKQRQLLDQAFVSSQRMVYLIADLLNVSRLRTGKFVIDAQPTDLATVIEGELDQLQQAAKARGLELIYDKPKDFPQLMLDETKTRQVIMNFADNAIYYTPPGGHITVSLADKKDSIEFTVTDDGIGVPRSEQSHLFTKFYRAGNAKNARPDGTGLGLFMAKKVIVAQGGAIIFKSQEGKGSTFGFTFPKSRLRATQPD